MSCGGPLSALMMTAGSGLLQNTGIGVNTNLVSNLGSFDGLPVVSQFSDIVTSASGQVSSGVLESLRTMGQDFVALTNAIPDSFTSALAAVAPDGVFDGGFTGLISDTASSLMGNGDLGVFGQVWNTATGYIGQANDFINSSLNLSNLTNAEGGSFWDITGGMDNIITGSFSQITEALGAFGDDLSQLGNLINLDNLADLGSPAALMEQLGSVGGVIPAVDNVLRQAGVSVGDIADLASGSLAGLTNSANRVLYEGMTNITGAELAEVKSLLGITTPGIQTMADLLDPTKILPSSFPSLTMPTPDGLRGIYATTAGAVNSNLEKFLIDPTAPVYTGDDPIVRARLGLPPLEASA